jgi:NAD-dependent DNA ligase
MSHRCPKGTKRYAPVGPDCYTQEYIDAWQSARRDKSSRRDLGKDLGKDPGRDLKKTQKIKPLVQIPKEPTPKEPTPKEPTPKELTPKALTPKEPTPKEPTPKEQTPKEPLLMPFANGRCPKGTKKYAPVGPGCYTQAFIEEWQKGKKDLKKINKTQKIKTPEKIKTPKKIKTPEKPISEKKEPEKLHRDNTNNKPITMSDKKLIATFVLQGKTFLETLSEEQLSKMVLKANKAYHTEANPLMSDAQYDVLRSFIEDRFPDNTAIMQIGAPVKAKDKVTLPYNMPSMDKIKPDKGTLDTWISKYGGPYVISCKLDGVSGMYDTTGSAPKLYTRGDGSIGQDISHLIKSLKLPQHNGAVVRGEFIMTKAAFANKYATQYANARNLVAGFVNSKTLDKTVHDIKFVCYEVIKPEMQPSDQMRYIASIGHEVVQHTSVATLSQSYLMDTLLAWRASSAFEMDGIIVADDYVYPRTKKNPEHAFAFKMVIEDQQSVSNVIAVHWKASQDGYLKPRIQVEPVRIGGVTIEYATGFNAKFIKDNKIGPGAVVQIIRSGDVIPYIQSVITSATEASMPTADYVWNATGVDIVVADLANDPEVKSKNIVGFFSDLDVEGLGAGNVKRLIEARFDSVPKILHMSKADFGKVDGFKDRMAEKVHTALKARMETVTLVQLMAASNKFGRGMGIRVITPLLESHPDFLTNGDDRATKLAQLNAAGIHKNAETFIDSIEPFTEFLKECGLETKLHETPKEKPQIKVATHALNGKSVVMTKVRDQEIIDFLPSVGATLEDGIKANTVALVVKDTSDETNKTRDAKKKGVPIMSVGEFKDMYLNNKNTNNNNTTNKDFQELVGKSVVMTKVRNQTIQDFLTSIGSMLEDGIKANTVVLIVKDKNDETAKTKDAKKKGIPIMTVAEFKEKYM